MSTLLINFTLINLHIVLLRPEKNVACAVHAHILPFPDFEPLPLYNHVHNPALNKSACLSAGCFAKLDMLAPLVITDLKHYLQTSFVVSVDLPLLSATVGNFARVSASSTYLGWSAGALSLVLNRFFEL